MSAATPRSCPPARRPPMSHRHHPPAPPRHRLGPIPSTARSAPCSSWEQRRTSWSRMLIVPSHSANHTMLFGRRRTPTLEQAVGGQGLSRLRRYLFHMANDLHLSSETSCNSSSQATGLRHTADGGFLAGGSSRTLQLAKMVGPLSDGSAPDSQCTSSLILVVHFSIHMIQLLDTRNCTLIPPI